MQLGGGMRHLKPDHIQIFDLQYAHLVSLSHNCTAFSYRAFTSVSARLYKSKGVGYNVMLNKSNTKICQKCTWFGFVTNEDFCSPAPPPPPCLEILQKIREKFWYYPQSSRAWGNQKGPEILLAVVFCNLVSLDHLGVKTTFKLDAAFIAKVSCHEFAVRFKRSFKE